MWCPAAMTDGGYQSTTRYDSRVLQLSLLLNVATQEAAATALQNLHRELDRSTNFLKWQPDTLSSPVFFRTWRTSPVEVVGVPAARAVYRILLEIPADPFARGLLETINVGTVNTATGYFDVATASIKGDVEAPILLLDSNPYIGTGPGSANATLNWLLARSTRSATSQPSMVQCSTLTMGTDTAVSATDALTTFTTTSSATRLTWSPTGATAAAMNGRYRLMVGATITATTSSATFTISAKYGRGSFASFNAPTSFSETVTPTGTQKYLLDFGIIDFSEALTATLTLAPRVEIIAASTSTTVTKTILWDFLYLVPADEALALTSSLYLPAGSMPSGGTYPTTNPMIYDGDAESVQIVSSTSIFTTATAVLPYWAQYNGSIPAIKPGSDNRFFYMRYASGITATPPWSEYSTSGSGTLTLYYYPLYLYVRPATT